MPTISFDGLDKHSFPFSILLRLSAQVEQS